MTVRPSNGGPGGIGGEVRWSREANTLVKVVQIFPSLARYLTRRNLAIAGALVMVLLIGALAAFEPVTRNLVAREGLCAYCHLEWEYIPTIAGSWSRPMRVEPRDEQAKDDDSPYRVGEDAREGKDYVSCIDCHVPHGFMGSINAWLHFASITDFFGHLRDRDSERSGDWIPPRRATAFRVRDRLFESDSVTCRGCHVEADIKPRDARGQKAHVKALEQKQTCIECHRNIVHQVVDLRKGAFKKAEKPNE